MRLIDADALIDRMKRTSRFFDVVYDIEEMPTINQWIPWKEFDGRLKDHYFYLVTHRAYATPMKAKYHIDMDCFEIINAPHTRVYTWDDLITAWMDLPEVYREEKPNET